MVGIHDLDAYFDIAASAGGVNIVPHVRPASRQVPSKVRVVIDALVDEIPRMLASDD